MRKGSVRILVGSTGKMGAGMNVQNRLIALHHLDVPWKPSDIEQQEGRIIRQGNMNDKVQILRYITENTFDAYSWQIIENKQKFISQIMTSKSPARSCEDIDENVFSAAEAKALAVGNPLIKEKIELDNDVSRLRLLKGNFENERYRMQDDLNKKLPRDLEQVLEQIHQTKEDLAYLSTTVIPDADNFKIVVDGVTYTDKKEGGSEILNAVIRNRKEERFTEIGEYAGFRISGRYDEFYKDIHLKIQRDSTTIIQIGNDPLGTITRINNVLQKMPERLTVLTEEKERVEAEMENIKMELLKPFEKQNELEEKTKRLAELTAVLEIQPPADERNVDAPEQRNIRRM